MDIEENSAVSTNSPTTQLSHDVSVPSSESRPSSANSTTHPDPQSRMAHIRGRIDKVDSIISTLETQIADVHSLLMFNSREISHANNTNQPSETIIRLESSSRLIVDTIQPDQQIKQLHVPKDRNYAGVDAWIPGFGAFQITVGQTHTIDKTVPNKLSQLGRGANRLYWLLPSFRYNSWTKKTPFDIEQYAILIPTPSSVTDNPIVSLP